MQCQRQWRRQGHGHNLRVFGGRGEVVYLFTGKLVVCKYVCRRLGPVSTSTSTSTALTREARDGSCARDASHGCACGCTESEGQSKGQSHSQSHSQRASGPAVIYVVPPDSTPDTEGLAAARGHLFRPGCRANLMRATRGCECCECFVVPAWQRPLTWPSQEKRG